MGAVLHTTWGIIEEADYQGSWMGWLRNERDASECGCRGEGAGRGFALSFASHLVAESACCRFRIVEDVHNARRCEDAFLTRESHGGLCICDGYICAVS